MGRLFDGPFALIVIFLIIVAVVVVLVVTSMNKSKKTDFAYIATPTDQYPAPADAAVQRDYMQGMSHRSNSIIFGVIGLFILGIVFGPLALVQANKAEALGVNATAGKVLGWIAVGFSILWLIFIVTRLSR